MATNFPTSLDTFTNPNSGNTLDSPSHSVQHSDINDAVEAIEAKIGVGSSTAGSATAGYALVNTSGGTTAYSLLGVTGLSSGTAVANTVLTANGSGAATFAPIAQGLTLLIPSSVAVGSGTGTVSATGTVTFSGASSVSVNDVFSATYNNYRIVCHINNTSTADGLLMRLRVSGADNTTANYNYARTESNSSATANRYGAGQTSFDVNSTDDGGLAVGFVLDLEAPFAANHTVGQINVMGQNSSGAYSSRVGGYVFSATTSFTGYTVYPGSGTITGSISTYAYNA